MAEIRGADGSLLDLNDAVLDSVDDMEELIGVLERLSARNEAESPRTSFMSPRKAVSSSRNTSGHCTRSNVDIRGSGTNGSTRSGVEFFERSGGDLASGLLFQDGAGCEPYEIQQNVCSPDEEQLDSWAKESWRTTSMVGHNDGITCVHYDGHLAVSGGRDRLVRLWDANSKSVVQTFTGHTSNLRCLQERKGLVISGAEPAVRVWNAQTGEQTASLEGHAHYVSCLSVDEELRLVTGSWDRTLRIWILPQDGSATVRITNVAAAMMLLCNRPKGQKKHMNLIRLFLNFGYM